MTFDVQNYTFIKKISTKNNGVASYIRDIFVIAARQFIVIVAAAVSLSSTYWWATL
jgi:hypothetical protein